MQKRLSVLLMLIMLLPIFMYGNTTEASKDEIIKVKLDSYPLTFDIEPRIVGIRTMVPFRILSESIGVDVQWDASTRKIYAKGNGKDVTLTINSKQATVNGKVVPLDAPAFIDGHRALIPLRFFLETFDATVDWNNQTREINITSPQREMYTFSFYGLTAFQHRQYVPYFNGMAYGWSHITPDGEFGTVRGASGIPRDYFWPQDSPLASTSDIIYSGQKVGGEAFLLVAAFDYNTIHALVHDQVKVTRAINDMVSVSKKNNFNGILIDFEGIRNRAEHSATKVAFTSFIEKLSTEAKKHDLKLSVALVPPNNAFSGYEYEKLGRITDFIFLMAYDYNPRDPNNPFAHMRPEPLSLVNQGIELTLKDIPKEKLVLGVNLVHETNASIPRVTGLAKRHNLKGVGFWLLNRLDDEKVSVINRSVKLN